MLGYGLAGAVSPYLGVVLRNRGPAAALRDFERGAAADRRLALSKVERESSRKIAVRQASRCPAKPLGSVPMILHRIDGDPRRSAISCISAINSAPFYLRFAQAR
mgnify:CR=1 FL=1